MKATAKAVPHAIASVEKKLPRDFKESTWTAVTQGFARKAKEFLGDAETK
jgi:hypothetical protein